MTPVSSETTVSPASSPTRTVQVEIWSDVACPWCYVGKRRFGAALAAFPHREHVAVTWRSFQLDPSTPTGPGRPEAEALAAHKGLRLDQVREMFAHVTAVAATAGLALDFDRTLSFNTFDAHRLVHVAVQRAGAAAGERLVDALFAAHFEQGADLGDTTVLVDVALGAGLADAGFDAAALTALLAGDEAADLVRDDLAQARTLGVRGVPFFVADRRVAVSGAQPEAVFTQLLEAAWREANPLTVLAGDPDAEACEDDSCAV